MHRLLIAMLIIGSGFALPPSQQNEMSPEQKFHSTLYKRYANGPKLEDAFPPGLNSIRIEKGPPLLAYPASGPAPKSNLACKSDLVVIGVVGETVSNPTAEDTFVFSDYSIRVSEIIRNNQRNPVQLGDTITLTHPGGTLTLPDGRTVTAVDDSEPTLRNGGEYLLYLQYLPQTRAYKPTLEEVLDQPDTYEIRNGKLLLVGARPGLESAARESLDALKEEAASCKN